MRIALLHPGAMGAALGAQLTRAGHEVNWLPEGRSEATRRRAEAAGLHPARSVDGCSMVISVVPPRFALDVARSVAHFDGLYVDANAISPRTATSVGQLLTQARFVDGAVVGPPPTEPGTTRIFLSGEHATDAAAPFERTEVLAVVLPPGATSAASALKMAYGAWTKGTAALLISVAATAEHFGVREALEQEWARSQPSLPERLAGAEQEAESKGWRWTDEMRENAQTFDEADQPPGFGQAAAAVFEAFDRPRPQ